ncbi:MAG: hypothetical protein FD161_1385 [Limisphaerales bacterium]|nr:MAG: hypothetical protein FD161_1385 [Limisphaerales bacterium]KAG0509462.1 MAG: hypothetical protein E1N63_1304 [Limisphaerales bacterium]TXT52299.1 MAG: hypothetical protein FD140_786 [Limisphaerales bacterium]
MRARTNQGELGITRRHLVSPGDKKYQGATLPLGEPAQRGAKRVHCPLSSILKRTSEIHVPAVCAHGRPLPAQEPAVPVHGQAVPEHEGVVPVHEEPIPMYGEAVPSHKGSVSTYERPIPAHEEAVPKIGSAKMSQEMPAHGVEARPHGTKPMQQAVDCVSGPLIRPSSLPQPSEPCSFPAMYEPKVNPKSECGAKVRGLRPKWRLKSRLKFAERV